MQPGKFTELFFLDEATAFAAGHRPCALCRRSDYVRFLELVGETGADAVDTRLHRERLGRRRVVALDELPDGAFVLEEGAPRLVLGKGLLRWTPGGYVDWRRRPKRVDAAVVTPSSLVDVLQAGWRPVVPFLHPSAAYNP